jgi:RND family efflux transporter MFP subunit
MKESDIMKKICRTLLLIGSVVMAASCGGNKTADSSATAQTETLNSVKTAQSFMADVPQDETYSSNVQAFATNNIAPQSPSRIQKINVDVGDFVSKGQILAEMDKVNLQQAKLKMVNDSTEYSRVKSLYDEGGVSKSDLDAMKLSYDVSKSSYDNLLENTILRSPISGVISARNYDRGDLYSGQPIYVVDQITPVKLLIGVSENDYTKIKRGDNVTITVDALPGQTFTGRINKIYPTMTAESHTVQVEVIYQNSNRVLRPGMYAKVSINFATNHSVCVPDEAIVKQQGSGVRYVYVYDDATQTVKATNVTLGRHYGDTYEILDGLDEGVTIVTAGSANVKDGEKVKVLND